MKPITDLHAHLLPGFDDGAKSVDISLEMARQAAGSGVRRMVCTPHCSLPIPVSRSGPARFAGPLPR